MTEERMLQNVLREELPLPGRPHFSEHLARYQRVRGSLGHSSRVLDAGCGSGYGARLLAESGHNVTGLDASPAATHYAASHYAESVRFLIGDACRLPFHGGSFDVVTCFEVIEHVSHPEVLIWELGRVLRPGGLLFLSTPHGRLEALHARSIGQPRFHLHISPLTPRRVHRMLRRHFSRVRLYGQTPDLGPLHLALKSLDPLGFRLLLPVVARTLLRGVVARGRNPDFEAAPAEGDGSAGFRFSRLIARSSTMIYAEAVK